MPGHRRAADVCSGGRRLRLVDAAVTYLVSDGSSSTDPSRSGRLSRGAVSRSTPGISVSRSMHPAQAPGRDRDAREAPPTPPPGFGPAVMATWSTGATSPTDRRAARRPDAASSSWAARLTRAQPGGPRRCRPDRLLPAAGSRSHRPRPVPGAATEPTRGRLARTANQSPGRRDSSTSSRLSRGRRRASASGGRWSGWAIAISRARSRRLRPKARPPPSGRWSGHGLASSHPRHPSGSARCATRSTSSRGWQGDDRSAFAAGAPDKSI